MIDRAKLQKGQHTKRNTAGLLDLKKDKVPIPNNCSIKTGA